jgi:hypothetical protein
MNLIGRLAALEGRLGPIGVRAHCITVEGTPGEALSEEVRVISGGRSGQPTTFDSVAAFLTSYPDGVIETHYILELGGSK